MLDDFFSLDGYNAEDYGIKLQKPIEFSPAVPIVEKIHIPGRNGDLIFDTGAYENRTARAMCFALSNDVNSEVVRASNFLLSDHGYRMLITSNDLTHFWKARIVNGPQIENRLNKLNPFEIEFDCMPQRFLSSGLNKIANTTGTRDFVNSYGGVALPLIKIYRRDSGDQTTFTNFKVGSSLLSGSFMKLNDYALTITIDCETQNMYSEDLNVNFSDRVIVQGEFPKFDKGTTTITFDTSQIKKIEVIPRWWDL